MVTNLFIRMPSCLSFKGRIYRFGHYYRNEMFHSPEGEDIDDSDSSSDADDSSPIVTVRTFFPETWLWDLFETG